MAPPSDDVVARFYAAFAAGDGAAMARCYAADATFTDPVFPGLANGEPGAMWRMLTSRGGDPQITLVEHETSVTDGSAHWLADYVFTPTSRAVHNDVRAALRLRDGLIVEHVDRFSFHAWSRQALGAPGLLLGWTPLLRRRVQKDARAQLDAFIAEHGPGTGAGG